MRIMTQRKTMAGGFTLIELVVAAAIGLVMLGALFSLLFSGFKIFDRGMSKIHVLEEARLAMEWIKRDVREATFNLRCGDGRELKVFKTLIGQDESVVYNENGRPGETEPVIYLFKDGTLSRNGKILGKDFSDVRFSLRSGDEQWLPIVSVNLTVEFRKQVIELGCHVIPRAWAAYEKCRYWVSNASGQPMRPPKVKLEKVPHPLKVPNPSSEK